MNRDVCEHFVPIDLHCDNCLTMPRDDRNPPDSQRRRCSKCKHNRPAIGGRTNKLTRLWRCAGCLPPKT